MKPSQAIEPEVSFTVALRLRPVAARADVSPIVSVADTRNINVTEIMALILNSGLNGIIDGNVTIDVIFKAEKSTTPINIATI